MIRISVPYSHAFNGGQVSVDLDDGVGPDCLVEFIDGVTLIATVHSIRDSEFEIEVPPYITAKGSPVAGHTWRIVRRQGETAWRMMLLRIDNGNDKPS